MLCNTRLILSHLLYHVAIEMTKSSAIFILIFPASKNTMCNKFLSFTNNPTYGTLLLLSELLMVVTGAKKWDSTVINS